MSSELVNLAREFGIILDGPWKIKWAAKVKTGQVTQLERKIIDVVINHHTSPRDLGVNAKTEHAKFAKQFQDGMHAAMKKLYKQAAGARDLSNLGELSIEGQDPDPPTAEEEGVEGGDGSGQDAEGAAAPGITAA